MSREIYYNEKEGSFFIREAGTNEDGDFWSLCSESIQGDENRRDKLAQAYTNGLNAAEWKEEEEAMTAFLNSSDILLTGLTSETKAKDAIFGSDRLLPILKDQSKFKAVDSGLHEESFFPTCRYS